jgi:hypothetical protein
VQSGINLAQNKHLVPALNKKGFLYFQLMYVTAVDVLDEILQNAKIDFRQKNFLPIPERKHLREVGRRS